MTSSASLARAVLLAAGGAMLLAGCGSSGILGRERPDEFAVQRQAPLVVPPDFELVPPGARRPAPDRGHGRAAGAGSALRPAREKRGGNERARAHG